MGSMWGCGVMLVMALLCIGACYGASMTLTTLSGHPHDSACLDGSPYAYYYRPGNATTKWVIHHQGGGWCTDLKDCYYRSTTVLGSSKSWAQTIPSWVGILDDDPTLNPNYHDWNAVILYYCDGSSFSSYNEQPVPYYQYNVYLKGKNNLIAASSDLLVNKSLSDATDVIITGCSAGGLSTYVHLDFWRSVIPSSAIVRGIADAGWFLDADSIYGKSIYTPQMQAGLVFWNSTGGLNQACVTYYAAKDEVWKCLFAEYIYPFIKTPIFVTNSKNDNWQAANILDLPCSQNIASCNSTELASLHSYSDFYLKTVSPVLNSTKDGMFVSSCYTHCQTIDDAAWTLTFLETEDGTKVSPSIAFTNWYYGKPETKAFDQCEYPCNPTCQSY